MSTTSDNNLLKPLEELGKPFESVIIDVQIVKARDIFGESAISPDKEFLQISLDNTKEKVRLPLPQGLKYINENYVIED